MSIFNKPKKNDWDFVEINKDSIPSIMAEPWYPPTPTTVVVGTGYGTTAYNVKEETDHLIGRMKDATAWHDDDKFLVCLDVDDYSADQVWIRVDQIFAIIKNRQNNE